MFKWFKRKKTMGSNGTPPKQQPQKKSSTFGVRQYLDIDIQDLERINKESGLSLDHGLIVGAIKNVDCVIFCIEYREKVIGYVVYHKKDKFIKILDICIDPYYRRCGAGTEILSRIKKTGAFRFNKKIMILVHESKTDMHLFLRANGFKCTSINKYGEYKFQYEKMD